MQTEPALIPSDQIQVTNPSQVRAVYANNIGVSATLTDFRLFFTELGLDPSGFPPTPLQEVKAIVAMPMAAISQILQALQQIQTNHAGMMKAAADESAGRRG